MTRHLQREVEKLKKRILDLSKLVEDNVKLALTSIHKVDGELVEKVREMDRQVDMTEIEIEEDCLKILALHQPVAIDLRYIVAVLKINNDLERVGDLALNILQSRESLDPEDYQLLKFDLDGMADKAKSMLKRSLQALVEKDAKLAAEVLKADEEVDDDHRTMYKKVKEAIKKHPTKTASLIRFLQISRNLERIADQATNIAEDVIYLIEGKIVRHHS